MVDIPGWAIGVVAILGGLGVMAVLIQLGDGVAHGLFGVKRRLRGPHTVIGMNVGTGSGKPAALPPAALEDLHRRVAELEERLDFAERLLAKRPDSEKLIPPR